MNLIDKIIYSKNWGIRILRHFAFWFTDSLCYLLVISANAELKPGIIKSLLFVVPLAVIATYFIIYFIIPTYSKDRNRLKLITLSILVFLFVGVGMRYYRFFIIYPLVDPTHAWPSNMWGPGAILGEVFSWLAVMSSAIAIKMAKNKAELQEKNQTLLEERKIAELSFLKAQMHPHFLFNTLNTLYSEIIRGGNRSEQIVLRLSSLLRFMLEECNQKLIPLEKEIKVIEDYVQLEKLRHGDRLQINYECSAKTQAMISPLLMLPFVENSCKHTLSSMRGEIQITIQIKTEKNSVNLFVENELSELRNGSTRGIGIANVKRQLELLFDRNFTLDIQRTNGKHTVNLKMPIQKDEQDSLHYYRG